MEVQIAVAKLPKYGLGESGDTVEVVERPRGGLTAIMADGQNHGKAAKRISHLVVAKAAQLIADGVRDGAVGRGVHDYLYAIRDGKVSTELVMISVDLRTKSLVVARNSHVPVLLLTPEGALLCLDEHVEPIGVREQNKPIITEVELQPGILALAFTDGVFSAGRRYGRQINLAELQALVARTQPAGVQALVDSVLQTAVDLDQGRPGDDMAVMAVGVGLDPDGTNGDEQARRLFISMSF